MNKLPFLICLLLVVNLQAQTEDEQQLKKFFDTALTEGKAYGWLNHLSNQIGGRLTGSVQAEQAIAYTKEQLDSLGLDRVWLQPVKVPKWVRGTPEFAYIETSPGRTNNVPICALGGSIATPNGGLKAEVVEVQGIADLKNIGADKIKGKIVFFNKAMNPKYVNTFEAYDDIFNQRYSGAAEAAKYGAVGVIVRSLNLRLDDYPHTGAMSYGDIPKAERIPAAAISTKGAELLSTTLTLNPKIKFYFNQNCRQLDPVLSYNVIGEIKGTTHADEIILLAAHLDSWDLGDGSHDNGAGCVQSLDVLNLFKTLDYKPKRTIRVVLFMNNENGFQGAEKYANVANVKNSKHIFALESDAGGFTPQGFSFSYRNGSQSISSQWQALFKPYLIHVFNKAERNDDISFLKDKDLVLSRLITDTQRYFDYHHSENDQFKHVNRRELHLGTAAMASMVFLVDKYGIAK